MNSEAKSARFSIGDLPSLIAETASEWSDDDPWRLSAVVAYYALLSLPGLLVIIINLIGAVWGAEIVQGKLTDEISTALGPNAAEGVAAIIENAWTDEKSTIATVLGIGILIFGATGVFYQLQQSINKIWEIRQIPETGYWKLVVDRLISFGFVLIMGFLLLTSFLVSALISLLDDYITNTIHELAVYMIYGTEFVLSIVLISVLFALIFKFLPDVVIQWKTVWTGGLLTALLFMLGKELLSLYFGAMNPGSTYGAAGSLVLIMLWVSYSCLILFFGAEFTWVYARRYGHSIKPQKHAMLVKIEEVVTNGEEKLFGEGEHLQNTDDS